jgi:hypothetical protein
MLVGRNGWTIFQCGLSALLKVKAFTPVFMAWQCPRPELAVALSCSATLRTVKVALDVHLEGSSGAFVLFVDLPTC